MCGGGATRLLIRIPALTGQNKRDGAYALTDWIGITDQGKKVDAVKSRGFGTHHMNIGENKRGPGTGSFVEEGGKPASMANKTSKGVKLFGLDLAAGGLGRRDFNGDVILPDGAHGHMFIGFTKPTKKTDGALQIGLETTGPGVDGLVGNKHNWLSTEATANPESSFFGHKMQKIGGGGLKVNQRLVDLNKVQRDAGQKWLAVLDEFATDLDAHARARDRSGARGVREPRRSARVGGRAGRPGLFGRRCCATRSCATRAGGGARTLSPWRWATAARSRPGSTSSASSDRSASGTSPRGRRSRRRRGPAG